MRKVFGSTDRGLVRSDNQDSYEVGILSDGLCYAVLCDGMGGENGGSIASRLAVDFAKQALERDLAPDMGEMQVRSVFASAIAGANALIFDKAQEDEELRRMGTTMILAAILGDTLYVSSVGDSRVYLTGPGDEEQQLTKDHTVVQMMVDNGEITKEDAAIHPKRHYITRVVGVSPDAEPDFSVVELVPGQIVLLCSDGLYNYLQPGQLPWLLRSCLELDSAQPLIDLALDCGGEDNVTAVILS